MLFPARFRPEAHGRQWKSTRCSKQQSPFPPLKLWLATFPQQERSSWLHRVWLSSHNNSICPGCLWTQLSPEVSYIITLGSYGDRDTLGRRFMFRNAGCFEVSLRILVELWQRELVFPPSYNEGCFSSCPWTSTSCLKWDNGVLSHCCCQTPHLLWNAEDIASCFL